MTSVKRAPDEKVNWISSIPFLTIHALALGFIITGVTLEAVIIFLVMYWSRIFFITAGYHRYFSHKSYKASRPVALILAIGGSMAAQKGPLWWAAHHRDHHRYSDTEKDVHSPLRGFWWSHVGWILCDKYGETKWDNIKDLSKYPELRFVEKWNIVFPIIAGVACWLIGGWPGLFFGFFLSTVFTWHCTFFVNSLAHVMGRRRYVTLDTSRNSAIIAFLTMGEGWHNNHHYYPTSVRQGFFWWEWDPSYYVLRFLSWFRIVSDLRVPPARVLGAERIKEGNLDLGMLRAHWTRATAAVQAAGQQAGEFAGAKRRAVEEFLDSARQTSDEVRAMALPKNQEVYTD